MLASSDYHRYNFTCHISFSFRQLFACQYSPNANVVVTLCRAAGHFNAHKGVKKHQGCCVCKKQQGFKFLSQSSIHGSPCDAVEKLKYIYMLHIYTYICTEHLLSNLFNPSICTDNFYACFYVCTSFLYDLLWRPRFNSRPVHVGSVVDKVSL